MMEQWKRYERSKAKAHRGRHVGGSRKPDYIRGDVLGEIKCRQKPLTKTQVKKIAQKGVTEIISKSGFTTPAIKYVKQYRPNLKLFHRGKRRN
jgi:hypothetical protein